MLGVVFILLGVALLFVAGFGLHHPRAHPQWIGWAFVVLGVTWPTITAHFH